MPDRLVRICSACVKLLAAGLATVLAGICSDLLLTAWAGRRFGGFTALVVVFALLGTLALPLLVAMLLRRYRPVLHDWLVEPLFQPVHRPQGDASPVPLWLAALLALSMVAAIFTLRLLLIALSTGA